MAAIANPVVGDLVLVGPGTSLSPGLYVVTAAVTAGGPYTVASAESSNSNHAATIPKSRILAVYRAA